MYLLVSIRRVPLCLFVLLSVVVVAIMYALFMNVA